MKEVLNVNFGAGAYEVRFTFKLGHNAGCVSVRCESRRGLARVLRRWRDARRAVRKVFRSGGMNHVAANAFRRYSLRWLACRSCNVDVIGRPGVRSGLTSSWLFLRAWCPYSLPAALRLRVK